MRFTRRQNSQVLRSLLPMLALVWCTVAMHPCNSMSAVAASPSSEAHCDHHVAVDSGSESAPKAVMQQVSCTDLGTSAPDSRPPVAESLILTLANVPAFALAVEPHPSTPLRIQSAAPEPPRPLRLQYSELLI
jgi:hypothetical protein